MPFMYVGGATADVGGNYNGGGDASFRGPYVQVSDQCGDASLNGDNGINWGYTDKSDCKFNSMQICEQFTFFCVTPCAYSHPSPPLTKVLQIPASVEGVTPLHLVVVFTTQTKLWKLAARIFQITIG